MIGFAGGKLGKELEEEERKKWKEEEWRKGMAEAELLGSEVDLERTKIALQEEVQSLHVVHEWVRVLTNIVLYGTSDQIQFLSDIPGMLPCLLGFLDFFSADGSSSSRDHRGPRKIVRAHSIHIAPRESSSDMETVKVFFIIKQVILIIKIK